MTKATFDYELLDDFLRKSHWPDVRAADANLRSHAASLETMGAAMDSLESQQFPFAIGRHSLDGQWDRLREVATESKVRCALRAAHSPGMYGLCEAVCDVLDARGPAAFGIDTDARDEEIGALRHAAYVLWLIGEDDAVDALRCRERDRDAAGDEYVRDYRNAAMILQRLGYPDLHDVDDAVWDQALSAAAEIRREG